VELPDLGLRWKMVMICLFGKKGMDVLVVVVGRSGLLIDWRRWEKVVCLSHWEERRFHSIDEI
jgi:hypothetical protein